MTPHEYVEIEKRVSAAILELREELAAAYRQAKECPLPVTLRPANADDIVAGAVIWYPRGDEGHFWKIVSEPRFYGDAFKAYVADDGSRYGLDGAYVEVTA